MKKIITIPDVYGVLWYEFDVRDELMSCCHWWWVLQGLDLNMLGQCLLEEAMIVLGSMRERWWYDEMKEQNSFWRSSERSSFLAATGASSQTKRALLIAFTYPCSTSHTINKNSPSHLPKQKRGERVKTPLNYNKKLLSIHNPWHKTRKK